MDHTRHSGIFDVSKMTVTIVGAGGIGAITAVALAKMGVGTIVLYDDDVISEVNMPTQLHKLSDLNRPKVFSLGDLIAEFSDDTEVYPDNIRITDDMTLYGTIVIAAVDSIAARKAIWAAACRGKCQWYLDTRMAAEEFHIYSVDMHEWTWYDKIIHREDDANVQNLPCTAKATFYCAAMAAGHIGSVVRKIATGIQPARYLVHNILNDSLLAIRE